MITAVSLPVREECKISKTNKLIVGLCFPHTNHFVIWKSKRYLSYNVKVKSIVS